MKRDFSVLVSFFFLINLFLLLINDHYLKATYPSWWTGKLSDFTGLIVFSLFFTVFFPRFKKQIFIITAIGFVFWKSPLSNSFIEFWNQHLFYSVSRVVDYTDLWALLILPIAYYFKPKVWISQRRWLVGSVSILTFVVMAATSASDKIEIESSWGFVEEKNGGLKCITEKGICIKKVTESEHINTYILTDTLGRPKNINNYNLIEVFTDSLLLIRSNGVHRVHGKYQSEKWGLMTIEGEVLVEPEQYDLIYEFDWHTGDTRHRYKHLYKTEISGKVGLIQKDGTLLLEPIYNEIITWDSENKYIRYQKEKEKGLITVAGEKILRPVYWNIERINEHLIKVDSVSIENRKRVVRIGLRDNEGKVIHPCNIDYFAKHQSSFHLIIDGQSKELNAKGELLKN